MRKTAVLVTSLALLSLSILPANSSSKLGIGDLNIAAVYSLDKCYSSTDLDCIESVGVIDKEGKYLDAKYESGVVDNTYIDPQGNIITSGRTIWNTGDVAVSLNSQLDTPNHIIGKFPDGTTHYGAALRIYISVPDPLNTKVRVKVRTSWIKPQSIQVKEFDSSYLDEIIPGGHRWTFEGTGLAHSSFNGPRPTEAEAKADYDAILFDIYIHHAGIDSNHSYFAPICADKGYTVQSNNTNETGEPMWDANSQSLIFGVYAPHFTTAGQLNLGYFKFWTTDEFLNCKFPVNTLSKSPNLVVQILNEDGSNAVATTQVSHANGKIFLLAAGFHFSAPKIILKAVKPVTPISAAPAKKISITCQKGKVRKTVTATTPKCPAGFKKVS